MSGFGGAPEGLPSIWSDAVLVEDVLGFEEKAEALASLLSSPETQTPLSVGIFSPSGGGKTTFLRLLSEALSSRPGMHVLWFDVTYQGGLGALALGLARSIISALRGIAPSEEALSRLDALCSSLLGRGPEAQGGPEWREIRRGLGEVLGRALKGGKLCVLLDDVHLTSAEGLSQLLLAITEWLALPGLVFVVAADPEVLFKVMEERERRVAGNLPGVAIERRARAVLDKLVQLSISLPGLGREEALRLWGRLAPGVDPKLVVVAASRPGASIRGLKQLANHFHFLMELARRRGAKLEPEVLLKFLVIKGFWEDVWRVVSTYLAERPSPLLSLQRLALGEAPLDLLSLAERSPFLKRCKEDLHLVTLLRTPPLLSEEAVREAIPLIKSVSPREDEQARVMADLLSGDPFRVGLAASVVSRMGSEARGAIVSEILHRAGVADPVGKERIAHALWAIAPSVPPDLLQEAEGFLRGLFGAEEPEAASFAVRAAARLCAALDPGASARLEAEILSLKEERYEVSVRAAVAAGLAELGGSIAPHRAERAIATLLSLTNDPEPVVRREAVRGLSSVPSPGGRVKAKVAERLLELLRDEDEEVIAGAAEGLVRLLPDLDEGRKELASASLIEATQRAAGPLKESLSRALKRALPHLPPHHRRRAEGALSPAESRK